MSNRRGTFLGKGRAVDARGRLMLGTSGFAYKHWRGVFYSEKIPQSKWLEAYAERFSSLELNVSFYRLPARVTFAEWARRTPDGFKFSVKGSRLITHYKRLRDSREPIESLLRASAGLGDKLECLLWQLPPRGAPDPAVLEAFARDLERASARLLRARVVRNAFELRDERWFADEVLNVLREHGFALVLADPPRRGQPDGLTADFTYLRFHHGPRESGAYETSELRPHAERAAEWLADGYDVLAYFNNDPGGWAPRNASTFEELASEANQRLVPSRALSQ